MKEHICQQGADHTPLGRALPSFDQAAIHQLSRCLQPSLNAEQHPPAVRMLLHRMQHQVVVDVIEEPLDIHIDHPVIPPASLAHDTNRIKGRFAVYIPIRIRVECRD